MDRRRAAGALLALAACIACSTAAPTASNQTALDLHDGPSEGCYYNFQHYGEGDRIMTNEPCLNCTCHNRMLMCYLRVCPFTKPIGQDCTIEKRADQCCPIVTCPDVPVDLLTSTSTSSPAEYGATGLGKVDKYGCSINGKYFSEGSKVPPTPNKPCEHCYCIRNMTTCVMQECTLHVDGCTPIYHKDICCPVRYSCDHQEEEMLLLDDMTTTVRPTPGFLLTTTTIAAVTQISQDCIHDDQIFADGALIKTEKACEHCYCMKGDIVCVVQECGTPMENEGKNCTSLPPRQGQCCPDTYICEGDDLLTTTTGATYVDMTTMAPPKRIEGSGYRNEPDEPYTEIPTFEGSGDEQATTIDTSDVFTSQKQTPEIIDEVFAATEQPVKPSLITTEPDKGQNTVPDDSEDIIQQSHLAEKTTLTQDVFTVTQSSDIDGIKDMDSIASKTTVSDYQFTTAIDSRKESEFIMTTESLQTSTKYGTGKTEEMKSEVEATTIFNNIEELTTSETYLTPSSSEASILQELEEKTTTFQLPDTTKKDVTLEPKITTTDIPKDVSEYDNNYKDENKQDASTTTTDKEDIFNLIPTTPGRTELPETTSINPIENEIHEDLPPGRIPGEGDCLLNGVTYKNNTNVPNINNCHSSCKCVSSIVKCDPIICSPPPEHIDNMNDCQPIYDTPDACCPTYVCHSRETIPPESHSQMSGTESPKLSPEKPEIECQDEQCKSDKITPTSNEPCTSENCSPGTDDQIKDCENNACEQTETSSDISPPIKSPESCFGDTCLPSVEICTDGQCKQPSTSEHICNSESGCQSSEVCEGNDCGTGPELTIPKGEIPICHDQEGCKGSDTPEIPSISCDGNSDCKSSNEDILQTECDEQSCRRKEQSVDENIPTSTCFGSSCITKETVKDESSILTTESSIKDQPSEELVTETAETTDRSYSKSPESEQSPIPHDIPKVTKSEDTVTEDQDILIELSTIKSKEEKEESSSEDYGPYVTKTEEVVTEKQEIEDHQTIDIDTYTTKYVEQLTESVDMVTKETSTKSNKLPFATQSEEHTTEVPKKLTSSVTPEAFTISTDTDIKANDQKINEGSTDTNILEQFTQKEEIYTETPDLFMTSTKQPETGVSKQEHTEKDETNKELPEIYTTPSEEIVWPVTEKQDPAKHVTPEHENTISEQDYTITESSETLATESFTEKYTDFKNKQDGVNYTEAAHESTEIPEHVKTEHSIPFEQSTESHETKLEDTVTDKAIDDIHQEPIFTENPNVFTEKTPYRTTKQEEYVTEQANQTPQMIEMETSSVDKESKYSEETTKPSKDNELDLEKQNTYTTPVEYLTTGNLETHNTQSLISEEKLETQTQESSITEEEAVKQPGSPTEETLMTMIPQDFDSKENSTPNPVIFITTLQELPTKTIDDQHTPSEISEILEEHTDSDTIFDLKEISTMIPEQKLQEVTTHKEPSIIRPLEDGSPQFEGPHDQEATYKPISGMETTLPSILPDENEVASTAQTDVHLTFDTSEISTLLPETITNKYDITTSMSEETEKISIETSTSAQVVSEVATTESKQPVEEMPNYTQTSSETSSDYLDKETTEVSTDRFRPTHPDSDDKTIPVFLNEIKTEGTPLYTSHDLPHIHEIDKQYTEKEETTLLEQYVTEGIVKDTISTDLGENIHKPTEYPVSHETESQSINTQAPEIITQSQDAATKLVTELETHREMSTTPGHATKDEQTEPPMSVITEAEEQSTPQAPHREDVNRSPETYETTHDSHVSTPYEEKTETSDSRDTEQQSSFTENPVATITEKVLHSETSSQKYPEKENRPESTPPTITYSTIQILDIQGEKISPTSIPEITELDTSTIIAENIAPPATLPQEVIPLVDNDSRTDSKLNQTDILLQSTSTPEVLISSEESFGITDQEMSTKSPEISIPVAIAPSEETQDMNQENKPSTEDVTVLPQYNIDLTTTYSKATETLKEDQQQDLSVTQATVQESEHTILPELFSTKYLESTSNNHEDESDTSKPSKQEDNIVATYAQSITESFVVSEQPVSTDLELHVTAVKDQAKSTETPNTFGTAKDVTTPLYQEITTLKMESDNLATEKGQNPTVAPELERGETEQFTTEKQKITDLPETTKIQDIEHLDITQEMSTDVPEKESVTLVTASEGDIISQTEIMSSDKDINLPVLTETDDKSTGEVQDITMKPYTKLDDGDVTEKVESSDITTSHGDLVRIPEETLPEETSSESSVMISSPKETDISVPLETVTETSLPVEVETEILVPKETDIFIPKGTEPSVPKETDINVLIETESSTSKETETAITGLKVTEASVLKETDATEPIIPDVTDSSVPKETESDYLSKVSEKDTYQPKDELSQTSDESSFTPEPVYSSSETTPYLVELQEHTNKIDDGISTVPIEEEYASKSPEILQTERGDQPLDDIQEEVKEHTTMETIKLPSLPEQLTESPIPTSVEEKTEEVPISSESPPFSMPPLSATPIVEDIDSILSEEQSTTVSSTVSDITKAHELTTAVFEIEPTTDKKLPLPDAEKAPEQEVMNETTTPGDEPITMTKATTSKTPEDTATYVTIPDDKITKPQDKPVDAYSPTMAPELPKPVVNDIQPTEEIPSPDFPPSGTSGYGQEPDYVEEDQAFGPGTCRYGGKVYVSAQQIPRDDPCDFCFCFRSDIICLQQSCPPPIHGCHEEPIQGFCCPRYECPVSMATTLNVTTTTTTTTTTLPPHFLPHAYKGAAQRRGCQIKGHSYKVGEVVRASSGPCLHCTCGGDGQMKCDPKVCTPEPMLRQMIAAAVSSKRRR